MADDLLKFCYKSNDLIRKIEWTANADSQFDRLLQSRWNLAKQNKYFHYNLDQLESRVLPGQYGFVSQLNRGRATLRRMPQEMMSLSQPFDEQKFNFTKVQSKEILMVLCNEERKCKDEDELDKDVIILNVSPIEHCSVLLVPSVNSQLPQKLTERSLQVAIETTILSTRRSLLVGYNSLCASASVNHLHFHAYYLEHKIRLQSEPTNQLAGPCHVMLSWPLPGFVFQLVDCDVSALARNIYKVAEYFHNSEVAHNVCLTRGSTLGRDRDFSHNTLRAFIWPRGSVYGVKPVEAFNVAFSELAGHMPIMNEAQFCDLSEESAITALQQAKLPSEKFQSLQKDVASLFIS